MKTALSKGETQRLISQAVTTFEDSIMGGYSENCTTLIFEDSVLVRFKGEKLLTANQKETIKSEMLRSYVFQERQEKLDSARPLIVTLVERIVGCSVITVHSDICPTTDDRVYVFTLDKVLVYEKDV